MSDNDKITALEKIVEDEKRRRIYYQRIVYAVALELERAFGMRHWRGEGIVCGTADSPSEQVQRLMIELVDRDQQRAKELALRQMPQAPGEKP